ncbi:MAG: aromatic acid exporter family protein [Propionibacterium sp.]|nr:aromatic acid exporter family protein [Propionibacterium sp.]
MADRRDTWQKTLQRASLKAFDLSERTARRGWRSQRRRVTRWQSQLFLILQIAVAGGVAWWIAHELVGHDAPFLATVAAIVCLGFSFGQRVSRIVEISVGVAIGVFLGQVFIQFFGTGVWQIMLAIAVAMSVAIWLGQRTLMATQAGLQAAAVMTVLPGVDAGFDRWLDAVIGCAVALVFALFAPTSPVQKPRIIAAQVLHEATGTLRTMADAVGANDINGARIGLRRARASEEELSRLLEASEEGMAVVRTSPFLRNRRRELSEISDLTVPLDRFCRNMRVLARRSWVSLARKEIVPAAYLELIADLAQVVAECSSELFAGRVPTAKIPDIVAIGERSAQVPIYPRLSPTVILAQIRSMLIDLIELCGVPYTEAREMIPSVR